MYNYNPSLSFLPVRTYFPTGLHSATTAILGQATATSIYFTTTDDISFSKSALLSRNSQLFQIHSLHKPKLPHVAHHRTPNKKIQKYSPSYSEYPSSYKFHITMTTEKIILHGTTAAAATAVTSTSDVAKCTSAEPVPAPSGVHPAKTSTNNTHKGISDQWLPPIRTIDNAAPEFKTYFKNYMVRSWRPEDRHECAHVIGISLAEYGLNWEPDGADRDVIQIEECYTQKKGEFWVVVDQSQEQDKVVGTAAFYPVDRSSSGVTAAVEIRKMYLNKAHRGNGIGKFLMMALEFRIAQCGYSKIYIETASVLKEACALYLKHGYIPAHQDEIETQRCDMILSKDLSSDALSMWNRDAGEITDCMSTTGEKLFPLSRKVARRDVILHRGCGVIVQNLDNQIFVHRRSGDKDLFPSMYDMFIGGVSTTDESSQETAIRELHEELGITVTEHGADVVAFGAVTTLEHWFDCVSSTPWNKCYVSVFCVRGDFKNEDVVFTDGEIEWGEFMSREEMESRLLQWKFVPDGLKVWEALVDEETRRGHPLF